MLPPRRSPTHRSRVPFDSQEGSRPADSGHAHASRRLLRARRHRDVGAVVEHPFAEQVEVGIAVAVERNQLAVELHVRRQRTRTCERSVPAAAATCDAEARQAATTVERTPRRICRSEGHFLMCYLLISLWTRVGRTRWRGKFVPFMPKRNRIKGHDAPGRGEKSPATSAASIRAADLRRTKVFGGGFKKGAVQHG
jgi:hypothetical protein